MRRVLLPIVVSAVAAAAGAFWLGRTPRAPSPVAPADAPNVLVLLWDTVRADRLSLYGHPRPTTPWLDAFARDAVVYERAISPGTWTVPSHGSLFTGLPVASHGATARWIWLDGRFETLAERLAAAGYDTWAWSSNPYLSANTNLLQGFATVETSWSGDWAERAAAATAAKAIDRDRSVEISPSWTPSGHGRGWPAHLTSYKDGGAVVPEAFGAWLDQQDGPWFAYVNYLEAHHPRVPTLASREALLDPELLERGLATDASLFHTMSYNEGRHTFDDAELDAIRGVYDASLRDLDQASAALVGLLEARGELDDTVVIVVSDHGEHLGEHGMFDHRWSVWQELIHVPLVIRFPAKLAPNRVRETVSTQDLFATVLDLVGLPPSDVPSRSLVGGAPDRAFAELVQPTPRLPAIRQAWPDLDPDRWRTRYQVLVEGPWKFTRASDGRHRLVDLDADPGEAVERVGQDPDRAERMKQGVLAWQEGLEPYDPRRRAPTDRPENALRADDTRAQLEALGYVDE